jgi:hypothetical protein
MFFLIENKRYLSKNQLQADALLNAYFIIDHFPLHASDKVLDEHLKSKYNIGLKNLCVKLLLSLTSYQDDDGNLILMFKNPKDDLLARLITYGNGAIPGSKILQIALKN